MQIEFSAACTSAMVKPCTASWFHLNLVNCGGWALSASCETCRSVHGPLLVMCTPTLCYVIPSTLHFAQEDMWNVTNWGHAVHAHLCVMKPIIQLQLAADEWGCKASLKPTATARRCVASIQSVVPRAATLPAGKLARHRHTLARTPKCSHSICQGGI